MHLRTQKLVSIWLITSLLAGLTLWALPINSVRAAGLCFVNAAASGANTGASWANAYTDLQSALGTSTCAEVWVAAGTYKPTTGTDRFVTFQLKQGVALYGGYIGTETQSSQRDWTAHVTILSGEIGLPLSTFDNSMHVVTGANNATLDGFTIRDGNASDPTTVGNYFGGGLYNENSSPTLTNLVFYQNEALYGGAGMYNKNGNPVMSHVIFQKNRVLGLSSVPSHGGGLENIGGGSPVLTDVMFIGNMASMGGGVYNESSSLTMTRAAFINNGYGVGGDIAFISGSGDLANIIFYNSDWSTLMDGAPTGVWVDTGANLILTNTTFLVSPVRVDSGGTLTLRNSIIASRCGIIAGSLIDGGGNKFTYACGPSIQPNITIDNLKLGPLADNGGAGYSLALLPGSSALGAASNNCPADDQRGQPRSIPCDSGAYEYNAKPFVATLPASLISATSAVLKGTVNANNSSTTVTFEYGLTDTYGSSVTASPSPVSGTADTPVSAVLTGLTPNTVYHYRVVAVNAGGTTNGADLTFASPLNQISSFLPVLQR